MKDQHTVGRAVKTACAVIQCQVTCMNYHAIFQNGGHSNTAGKKYIYLRGKYLLCFFIWQRKEGGKASDEDGEGHSWLRERPSKRQA